MATLLKTTGFLFSLLPYSVLERITIFLGKILILIPNKRKRIIFSNLRYSFPEWSHQKIQEVGLKSAAQMFEMGFFSLTYPFLSRAQKARAVYFDKTANDQMTHLRNQGKPVIFLIPHVSLFETLAVSQNFRPAKGLKLGAIYRPNKNIKVDKWIKESRISNGMQVFSRETALHEAKGFLRAGNWLALLFDQHSGIQGCHSYFLNRFASISTLPGLLAKSTNATVCFAHPKRISFFKTSLALTELSCPPKETPFVAHEILEDLILKENGLPEWLWAHERWKTQQNFRFHLRHRHKRQNLPPEMPRTTKFWIRMPNWLGDVVMTFPLLDAIRRGRPDASLTLLAKPAYKELLLNLGLADQFIALPKEFDWSSCKEFLRHGREYPSLIINFANSLRSDLECFALGAPGRYGLVLPGRRRPLLTHSYNPTHSHTEEGREIHQVRLWEQMLQYFGLDQGLNFSPIVVPPEKHPSKIGIMPGSANNPSKCWPLENWKDLIKSIQSNNKEVQINIFGASAEASLANSIASEFSESKVVNRCGKTNLWQLVQELSTCIWVIGNDSGGMHLSNSLGVPSIVLFGPTQSTCTKPIFDSPLTILEDAFASPTESVNAICEKIFRTEPVSDLSVQFN